MNIHEYQAKELFRKAGIPVPDGRVARSAKEALEIFRASGSDRAVIKAQIHAGGRGKAGGVKLVSGAEAVEKTAAEILNLKIKTKQTGGLEKTVRQVLVDRPVNIAKEFYLAVTLDREAEKPVIIFSPAGGMSIEEVAEKNPGEIYRLHFDSEGEIGAAELDALVSPSVTDDAVKKQMKDVITKTAKLFLTADATLVEINPLVVTKENKVVAVDAKIGLDDNALFRHPELEALRDPLEEDPREREAKEHDLSYVGLTGNIGCMVNGAGLAMATMDIIKLHGAEPANFLDVGGNATVERITAAFKILLADQNVKAILINIFGGIVRCDLIAKGILEALKHVKLTVPLVVRLEGTNAKEGKALLEKSGVKLIAASSLADAAQKVTAVVC